MGYTHYWRKAGDSFTTEQWAKLTKATKRVIQAWELALDHRVAVEYDEPTKPPHISGECIRFNGIGPDGHETFMLLKEPDAFEFCKTARKPYDDVVTAVLVLANHYAPQALSITSDGDPAEWSAGLALARTQEETAELPFQEAAA